MVIQRPTQVRNKNHGILHLLRHRLNELRMPRFLRPKAAEKRNVQPKARLDNSDIF